MNHAPEVLSVTPFFYYPKLAEACSPRFDPMGGMHLLIYGLVTALRDIGVNTRVINMGLPTAQPQIEFRDGITVHSCRYWVPPIPSRLEGYYGLVASWGIATVKWVRSNRKKLRHVKLVHCHTDGSGIAPWTGRQCAKILKVPLIMQIHSCRSLTQHPTTWLEYIEDPWAKRQERLASAYARKIFTLTPSVRNRLIKYIGLDPNKVEVLVFQTTKDFSSRNTKSRRKLLRQMFHLDPNEPIVLYVGRIAAEKGVEFLVESLPHLKKKERCRVIICGDGPMRGEIEKRINRLNVQDMCTITGFLKPEFVPSLIDISTVGVLPSRYEELGLVIIEFLTMGCPIVVHDVPNVRELVKPEQTALLVPPYQPPILANSIARLISDKSLRNRMSETAKSAAKGAYSLENAAQRVKNIYAEIAPEILE